MMTSKQSDVLSFFSNFQAVAAAAPAVVTMASAIPVREEPILPHNIGRLAQGEHFSVFKRDHAEEAALVYNYLLSIDSYDEFKENVEILPKLLNEGIYMYAISVALLHRKDTSGVLLPPSWEINPRSYFPRAVTENAKKAARRSKTEDSTDAAVSAPIFTTGTTRDTEFKLAWWREDIGLNHHHYHWHQVYPASGINGKTKDREGELFYYMHQQMLARYDAERLAVGINRVEPYVNWDQPIPEGYNSHLSDYYGTYQYAARSSNMYLADSWRDPNNPNLVKEEEYHYNRLLDAVNTGTFIKSDDTKQEVTIDSLGAAVESSISSPNMKLYGSVHNTGHDLIASITDPDGRYGMLDGVMCDTITAVRDPIFFRWHKHMDNLFVQHKVTLDPYTVEDLVLNDVTIESLQVQVKPSGEPNVLTTYMKTKLVDISHDMFPNPEEDTTFLPNTPINVKVTEVNHDAFTYNICVDSATDMKAAIRIFIAPITDANNLNAQRRLYIEMDKFVYALKRGMNEITRKSTDSAVIKPTDLTYNQLNNRTILEATTSDCPCLKDRYCECGWPDHMLLPRGTVSGMKFDIFVMATNWDTDNPTDNLNRGTSYCGVKNDQYPDKRSMGFPFDRKIVDKHHDTIKKFAGDFSNMFTTNITIKFTEKSD